MKTLTAFYDLKYGPVSYDVIAFLVQARMAADDAGCQKLHVVIVPDVNGVDGMFRNKLNLYDAPEKHWRLWNIVIPACRLVGASITLADDWAHAKRLTTPDVWPHDFDCQSLKNRRHLSLEIILGAKNGKKVPRLHSLEHARRKVREIVALSGKRLVTITLRNTYEPGRNSDLSVWDGICDRVRSKYHLIILRDTSEALSLGCGYGELNLELRMALYEEAVQNLHPHSGPAVLCWYSNAPFLMFGCAHPFNFWRENWEKNVGLKIDEQLPWARNDQRLVYGPISTSVIHRALDEWESLGR